MDDSTTMLTNFVGVFQAGYSRLQAIVNGVLVALAGIDIVLIGFWWARGGEAPDGGHQEDPFPRLLALVHAVVPEQREGVRRLADQRRTDRGRPVRRLQPPPRSVAHRRLRPHRHRQLAKTLADISVTEFGDMIIFGISYLVIMAAFLIVAIQVFLAVLEYYLNTVVAGVLVPWALLPQTRFLSEKAIGAVVSAGIKLMVLAFIIAVANPVLASIHFSGSEIKFNELWAVLLTTGAIAFLAWHAPTVAAGLLAGSLSLGAGAVAQNVTPGAMMAAGWRVAWSR